MYPLYRYLFCFSQDSDTVSCLCSWLVAMMDVTEHTQFLEDHGKSPWRYNRQVLDDVIQVFVRCKWGSILVTGLDIFQQVMKIYRTATSILFSKIPDHNTFF